MAASGSKVSPTGLNRHLKGRFGAAFFYLNTTGELNEMRPCPCGTGKESNCC